MQCFVKREIFADPTVHKQRILDRTRIVEDRLAQLFDLLGLSRMGREVGRVQESLSVQFDTP